MKKLFLILVIACFMAFTANAQTAPTTQTTGSNTEKQVAADHGKVKAADSKESNSDLKSTCAGSTHKSSGKSCCKGKSGSCSQNKAKACSHEAEESGEAQPAEKKEEKKSAK